MVEQGAYGILAEVESHPFPTDAMLFMDWRDEHTASNPQMQESNRCMHPPPALAPPTTPLIFQPFLLQPCAV